MKRLILGTHGDSVSKAGLDGFVLRFPSIFLRFVWRPPSSNELAAYLAARSEVHGPGEHWSDFVDWRSYRRRERRNLALHEFCEPFDVIELWFDKEPNEQLLLLWLLDHLRSYPAIVSRLGLRLVTSDLIMMPFDGPEPDEVPLVDVTSADIETASKCWEAYHSSTPQACFDLIHNDLSAFPLLRPAIADLLAELPSRAGLGATEMRLLELIASGYEGTSSLFYQNLGQRRVFNDMEIGTLLERLAHGPRPVIEGLDDALRTIDSQYGEGRVEAFQRSRLSVTAFGEAVLVHKEDFSSHNPIDRWWGGTHLTNDNLWRCDLTLTRP